jgi:hypothetical protein
MMTEQQEPFADVVALEGGFSIPELKWRELVFVGALRAEGDLWVREPSRPLPPFRIDGLFPLGTRFRAKRSGGRVFLSPEPR